MRGVSEYSVIPDMARNVYERSYRLGLFVKESCENKAVVSDDTGAMTYLAEIDFIRIGKGSKSIEEIEKEIKTKDAIIAIASAENIEKYKSTFPAGSVKLREWIINMPGHKKESLIFYSLKAGEYGRLMAKLNNFSAYLPPDIKVK